MSIQEQEVKKSVFKRWWFWLIIVVIFIALISPNDEEKEDNQTDEPTIEYEVVERDEEREGVLRIRAVTNATSEADLISVAENLTDEIIDTGTFEGLNTYAAYIRLHEPSDDNDFGPLILDSRIAYRSEGLPITGLDEINELYIADVYTSE